MGCAGEEVGKTKSSTGRYKKGKRAGRNLGRTVGKSGGGREVGKALQQGGISFANEKGEGLKPNLG